MTTPAHVTPSRPAVVLATVASFAVVLASAAGALTAPVVAATIAMAAVIAIISFHHSRARTAHTMLVPLRLVRNEPARISNAVRAVNFSSPMRSDGPDAA